MGVLAHNGDAVGAVAQRAEPGDMVGVKMSVHSLDQFEVELADQLQVAVDPLAHRSMISASPPCRLAMR